MYCSVKGTKNSDASVITASAPLDNVMAWVSIQSRSRAPTTAPATVTAKKNTMVATSSSFGLPRPIDTPRMKAASSAHIAPYCQVLGPPATTQYRIQGTKPTNGLRSNHSSTPSA